jgi:MFS family permease
VRRVRNPFASPLWQNSAFVRVWSAATISIFGSLITRMALPFVAILVLGAGAFEVALVRSIDLLAALLFGLLVGAWVDRLRRRPVMVWADVGRAALLVTIPIAAVGGWLTLAQLLLVTFVVAILSTFFDAADNAYLPSIVPRDELVRANGALAASGSAAEFTAFGISGFLVQLLSAPLAIFIDAISFVVSALLLGSIRRPEPPPPPKADREPVLQEIREGLAIIARDPIIRAFTLASMAMATLWGVFGAIWILFAIDELGLGAAAIGIIAGFGGLSSLVGATIAERVTRRLGVGRAAIASMLVATVGFALIPLAPAAMPILAFGFLVGQQLIGDGAVTLYDVAETSVRQARVHDRALGRVAATVQVGSVGAQLAAALAAGLLAEVIGLRATAFLAPLGTLVAAGILVASPVRHLRDLPVMDGRSPTEVVVDVERDQPVGA